MSIRLTHTENRCLFVHLTVNLHWPSRPHHNGCFVKRMFATALKYRLFFPEHPLAFLRGSFTHTHSSRHAWTHIGEHKWPHVYIQTLKVRHTCIHTFTQALTQSCLEVNGKTHASPKQVYTPSKGTHTNTHH